jgi:hypothetical protein
MSRRFDGEAAHTTRVRRPHLMGDHIETVSCEGARAVDGAALSRVSANTHPRGVDDRQEHRVWAGMGLLVPRAHKRTALGLVRAANECRRPAADAACPRECVITDEQTTDCLPIRPPPPPVRAIASRVVDPLRCPQHSTQVLRRDVSSRDSAAAASASTSSQYPGAPTAVIRRVTRSAARTLSTS